MTDQPAPTLTVVEASKCLNVQPSVVRRWIAEGRIAATKAGRGHRIAVGDLERVKAGAELDETLEMGTGVSQLRYLDTPDATL